MDGRTFQVNMEYPRAASQPGNGRSRRGLQWTLAALTVIPMASAVGEIVRGAQGVSGGSPEVPPTVDSSLRYANVYQVRDGADDVAPARACRAVADGDVLAINHVLWWPGPHAFMATAWTTAPSRGGSD